MIDSRYQPIYRQATMMQNKFHDYTHTTAYDPAAKMLQQQIHGLTNDIASGKNPRTIENRMKTIQTQLRRTNTPNPMSAMAGQSPILSGNQSRFLHSNFEQMRQNIRQHPNF